MASSRAMNGRFPVAKWPRQFFFNGRGLQIWWDTNETPLAGNVKHDVKLPEVRLENTIMHSIKKSISIGSTVCLGKKPFTAGGVKGKSCVDFVVGWDGETWVVLRLFQFLCHIRHFHKFLVFSKSGDLLERIET